MIGNNEANRAPAATSILKRRRDLTTRYIGAKRLCIAASPRPTTRSF